MISGRFQVKAVGVSFAPDSPTNLLDLALPLADASTEASLIREADNPHDPNAVAVLVAGGIVGHLPATIAARVGPEIDAGSRWRAAYEVLIDPDHPDRPGLLLMCERVEDPNV